MTRTSLRRQSRSRGESILARIGWTLAIVTMGQALAGVLVFVADLFSQSILSPSAGIGIVAFAGISEAGLASGLSLLAARPMLDVNGRYHRWILALLMTSLALPVVLGSALASGSEASAVAIWVLVIRTVVGSLFAVSELFGGWLGIVGRWGDSPWAAVLLAAGMTVWFLLVLPLRTFEGVPLVELLISWWGVLAALAVGSLRYYTLDRDLQASSGWSRTLTLAAVGGLVLTALATQTT